MVLPTRYIMPYHEVRTPVYPTYKTKKDNDEKT
jgi:hypothetical protein